MPSARTKRINKQLGDLYLHGWQISGPHSAQETPMSGHDNPDRITVITMLSVQTGASEDGATLAAWRIADDRGEIVFSAWCRRDAAMRLACYRGGSLAPADFPQWFVRTDDDWWQVRPDAAWRLPASAEVAV